MMNRKVLKGLVIAFSAILATGAIASRSLIAPPPVEAKIAPFVLKALEKNESGIPILVKLKKQADLSQFDDVRLPRNERLNGVYEALRTVALESQTDLVSVLSERGVSFRRFYIYNMVGVWGADGALVKELAERGDVEKIYGNPSVTMKLPLDFASVLDGIFTQNGVGDNITFMNANQIWETYKKAGDGIVVAGQDTGVEWDHPALVNQYRGTTPSGVSHDYNWHDSIHKDTPVGSGNDCGYDVTAPCDDGDHGSHTVGTIVGSDGDQNQIGMAPRAQWIACRNMDGGAGTPASYLECFEWLLAPYPNGGDPLKDGKPSLAPHVINNSWGCPTEEGCSGDEILPALHAMKTAGVMVVVSAGNEGPGCSTIDNPPAWHSSLTFSVGALDHRSGKIASFSSRGPSSFDGEIGPDVVAPGVSIRSSVRGHKYAGAMWSGTSMAGPHVAGAVALLWSIHPELIGDIDGTIDLFRKTAAPKTTTQSCGDVSGTAIPNNTYGYGVIDPLKVIQAADEGRIPAPPSSDPSEDAGSQWPSIRRK